MCTLILNLPWDGGHNQGTSSKLTRSNTKFPSLEKSDERTRTDTDELARRRSKRLAALFSWPANTSNHLPTTIPLSLPLSHYIWHRILGRRPLFLRSLIKAHFWGPSTSVRRFVHVVRYFGRGRGRGRWVGWGASIYDVRKVFRCNCPPPLVRNRTNSSFKYSMRFIQHPLLLFFPWTPLPLECRRSADVTHGSPLG